MKVETFYVQTDSLKKSKTCGKIIYYEGKNFPSLNNIFSSFYYLILLYQSILDVGFKQLS
jgi:hypothetical protein